MEKKVENSCNQVYRIEKGVYDIWNKSVITIVQFLHPIKDIEKNNINLLQGKAFLLSGRLYQKLTAVASAMAAE